MSPRVYTRKFDWDQARLLRRAGLTYKEIAERLGVSDQAVYLAVNDDARKLSEQRTRDWQRKGRCPDCGKPATRTGGEGQHRCRDCAMRLLATSVREAELHCYGCDGWFPDSGFPFNAGGRKLRRGRHHLCRQCLTQAKREWRNRNPEKQRAYDREYASKRRLARLEKMTPLQRATSRVGQEAS